MPGLRFNHMELTVPKGVLVKHRDEIKEFYGDVFGFDALDVPILNQTGLLLRTDPETSQFILVTEQRQHLACPGYDHLGFLFESRDEVDALLEKCRNRQQRDPRVELKEYEDLVLAGTTTHAFYVRFLLPIWFDVQTTEFSAEARPKRHWRFEPALEA
jgi:hypothetical protein